MSDVERIAIESESGNIVSAGYQADEQKMHVEFKGGKVYEYDDVTPDEWNEFEATFDDSGSSTGSHFHRTFRNDAHPCRPISI